MAAFGRDWASSAVFCNIYNTYKNIWDFYDVMADLLYSLYVFIMPRTRFRVNPYSIVSSNGWVFAYELSGCGFESSCSHLIFSIFETFYKICEHRLRLLGRFLFIWDHYILCYFCIIYSIFYQKELKSFNSSGHKMITNLLPTTMICQTSFQTHTALLIHYYIEKIAIGLTYLGQSIQEWSK